MEEGHLKEVGIEGGQVLTSQWGEEEEEVFQIMGTTEPQNGGVAEQCRYS